MTHAFWERNWNDLTEFFNYSKDIRRAIYTTNAIKSLTFSLRKVTRNKSSFLDNDSICKVIFLAIKMPVPSGLCLLKTGGIPLCQYRCRLKEGWQWNIARHSEIRFYVKYYRQKTEVLAPFPRKWEWQWLLLTVACQTKMVPSCFETMEEQAVEMQMRSWIFFWNTRRFSRKWGEWLRQKRLHTEHLIRTEDSHSGQ